MLYLLLMSAGAGIIGTGLGGVVGIFFGEKGEKTLSRILGFAAGVMLSIVCFDLIPEAIGISNNIWFVIASVLGGVLMVILLSYIVDKSTMFKGRKKVETHDSLDELNHIQVTQDNGKAALYKAGIVMLLAIALHNFPEGMAIGAGGTINQSKGLVLGVLIAIHNIPEGMSIASPLVAGGMNRGKAIFLTALSGASTILGGLVGYLVGSISPMLSAVSVAFAGGAMLYVTFGEIIPESILVNKGRSPSIFVIIGIVVGLILSKVLIQ